MSKHAELIERLRKDAVPQPATELGPDGKEWAKTEAGYAHVEEMLQRADGHCIGPFWYGWALRGAFVAGAEWQEARRQPEEGATKALAECRDIFPIPPEGHKLESGWLNAMGSPESVPDYLKACVEDLHRQIEDKELELKKLATAFQAQQRELASLKGA